MSAPRMHLNDSTLALTRRVSIIPFLGAVLMFGLVFLTLPMANAVSCMTQSQLSEADRNSIAQAAKALAAKVQMDDIAGLKTSTIASVAERFDSIGAAVDAAAPLIQRATITVESLYSLDSSDLKTTEDETQFFCGGGNSHEVVLTIPRIPPGRYALVIQKATGVESPQSITFILAEGPKGSSATAATGSQWKLAGAFIHGLTSAGHDGVWYWSQAREFARKKQRWNAYFYYQTASSLLNPVYFLSSQNLDKMVKEQAAVAVGNLPSATQPMPVNAAGQSFPITDLHTDGSLGGLDLVIDYQAPEISDPVAARSRNIDLMKAVLALHPELRDGFHGLWAFADSPDQRPFANELPMNQLQ